MDYQKTWEVMQGLEDSFNRITVIETLTNDLEVASNNNDFEEVKVLIKALSHYLPTFISHYDKASKKAWNNTVVKVAEDDVPYRNKSVDDSQELYQEVVKYYES